MEDLAERTAAEIAAAVRAREFSPTEVVEASLERIGSLDGGLGAFQLVRRERALEEAADLERPGVPLEDLPLAGVPIAIKDNVDIQGEPTRDGSLATSDGPRPADHEVVRRIRAAGAIIVGKTRVSELCVFGATDSQFGITRNPWDLDRTPGGSSGGSAAAVASGMVPIAHGNDGMGSVRIPAACSGIFGIKPGAGVVPAGIGRTDWRGLSENGALATTVTDAALLLSVMSGRADLRDVSDADRPTRIGISTNSPLIGISVDKAYKGAARTAGELLAERGHDVGEVRLPYTTAAGLAAIARWTAGTDDDTEGLDRQLLQSSIRRHADLGRRVKRRGWAKPEHRDRWRSRLASTFDRYDVVITPGLARPPIKAIAWGERSWLANFLGNARFAPFMQSWNLAGYPAAALPLGSHPAGVPLSVQVVATEGREDLVLSIARELEEARPWTRHAPNHGT